MTAIDHLQDPLREQLVALSHEYVIPDFVKTASETQLAAPSPTVHNAYALPSRKALPLHNKAAAWLSAVYLDNNPNLSAYERKIASEKLRQAAAVYGWEWTQKIAAAKEPEPTNDDYLISFESNGATHRRLPVRNGEEAKVAVAYLREHRVELPFETRKQASAKLLDKLKQYEVPTDEKDHVMLAKDACLIITHSDDLADLLYKQALLAQHAGMIEYNQDLMKVAKEIRLINDIVDDTELVGYALNEVEAFDRKIGRKQSAAVDRLSSFSRFAAEDYSANLLVLKSGHAYHKDDLVKVPVSAAAVIADGDLAKVSDDGFSIDIPKLAQCLESMNEAGAERAVRILTKAGVSAQFFVQPEGPTISEEEWKALANG
jgi:hypothetical protein